MSVYLDNNATTRVARESRDAMLECMEDYGNPSSMHALGQSAKKRLMDARMQVASFLAASPQEVVFTGSGTEGNHMAIQGSCTLNPGKRHIVTSRVEHPSTLALFGHLEKRGYQVTMLDVDEEGRLDPDDLEKAVTNETALVSLMWANNETGVIFPIEEAVKIAKSKGCLFHTDAVQSAGKLKIDLSRVPIDFLVFSGHKMHAPKGVGALFVRKGIRLPSLFYGSQERGRRGGTENLPGIAALGMACRLFMEDDCCERVGMLREKLEAGILESIPFARINGGGAERVPNTSSIRFGEMESEAILDRLDKAGIYASSGAACAAGGNEPSHVLVAMGLGKAAEASIRFSLSRYTTEEEIAQLLGILPGIVEQMTGRMQ